MDLVVTNARLLDRETPVTLAVTDGRIASISSTANNIHAARSLDAGGNLVVTPFVDPHFHLDKTLSRAVLGATTPREAFARAREVKSHFTVADVEERACEALRLAAGHGIGLIRAQVDVDSFTGLTSLEGVLAARHRYAHAIEVEIVAFPQEGIITDPATPELLREALKMGADLIGGLPEFETSTADQRRHLETVFDIAESANVAIDVHADYFDDPRLKTLEMLADMSLERGYQGRVTAGHCCALAVYPDNEARHVIDKLLAAEIRVSLLPMANLQMLGGPGRTPYNRGSSRMGELLDAGVPVAVGSDNMFDIWYRFNRMDPVELALITCLSGGLRSDEELLAGFEMTNVRAAEVVGRPRPQLVEGAPANFVVLGADNVVDVLRNLPGARTLVRAGSVVAGRYGGLWVSD